MEEETGEDTIQAADKVRQHQGYHEAEVTFGGEADLHKHYRGCKKNPGHTQFIPIGDFKIDYLPPDYRDNLWLDNIRAEADLTCRLSVRYTSESRPTFHPLHPHLFYPFYQDRGYDWMRVGTGWVDDVRIYKEKYGKNCICEECRLPGTQTPKKEWGMVYINTACHVVFDSDEAKHTTCHLFYDEGSTHISQCPSLTGLSVLSGDIKKDWCVMICVTHDMDLADKLCKMCVHRNQLWKKVHENYKSNKNVSCDSDSTPKLTVIISHPHGMSKQVSVGEWTHRPVLSPRKPPSIYLFVYTSYSYNTATCPGSSGANVIRLSEERVWWRYYRHVHSEGGDGNNNKSGVAVEYLPSCSSVLIERDDHYSYVYDDDLYPDDARHVIPWEVSDDSTDNNDIDMDNEDEEDGKFSNLSDGVYQNVNGSNDVQQFVNREDEEDDSTSHMITLSTSSSTNVRSDTTDGVSDDEDVKNVRQNKQRSAARERKLSESEDETPPKQRNQEPKGDVSKGEDSTETRTGGRTPNEADDSKSMGAATATGKTTTSSGACKKKDVKTAQHSKQREPEIKMSESEDGTPPNKRAVAFRPNTNQEPKGSFSKKEDSTETRTDRRASNSSDSKSMGGAMAKWKAKFRAFSCACKQGDV